MTSNTKWVYPFSEGRAAMRSILGGKGANLAEMTFLGLPVPPGFTIPTNVCLLYEQNPQLWNEGLGKEVSAAVRTLEQQMKKAPPLLLSVRSGAVESMPGMMDTVLNIGLNDETVQALAHHSGNSRFAWDCYRRLVQMFGEVVFQIPAATMTEPIETIKRQKLWQSDQEVTAEGWQEAVQDMKSVILSYAGKPFPQDVMEQLRLAIEAVFRSWHNDRARVYRNQFGISHDTGTAVTVQTMVFGNFGDDSGSGVIFTRNPSTGRNEIYGEYLPNAQGEDVVSGVRTPLPISDLIRPGPDQAPWANTLLETAARLEQHYVDMQDIEFTVEKGTLYLLQTRAGKRTVHADVQISADFVKEHKMSKAEAIKRLEPNHLSQLLHTSIDVKSAPEVWAAGLPASPGAATGVLVLDSAAAIERQGRGEQVILVREETTPEDIQGVIAAEGVLTKRGGMTSHAAVVARGMGKPCICGCEVLEIDMESRTLKIGSVTLKEGEHLSLDGSTGRLYPGKVTLLQPELPSAVQHILQWADEIRSLRIYANADHPEDARQAREFGAEGIGLCRTEHMFMAKDRLSIMQEMILADDAATRQTFLDKLLPMQQTDFEQLFAAMDGYPVTIRLLDPPLHEFLPSGDALKMVHDIKKLERIKDLQESNPMLGLRGCRLGIVYPEIYNMQIRAIFQAIRACLDRSIKVTAQVMIPLVSDQEEIKLIRTRIEQMSKEMFVDHPPPVTVGTMIEVPRAALTAGQIAHHVEFFSFGTNDLTQMTFGYSRDDAERSFLGHYVREGILSVNPFESLDEHGVGRLVQWATQEGKRANPKLSVGLCGEHGGDPASIAFCLEHDMDYISCSPYRVPLARIAAAQAEIKRATKTYGC